MPVSRLRLGLVALLAGPFVVLSAFNAVNKGGDARDFFEGGRRVLEAAPMYAGSSAAAGFIGPPFQALFFSPFAWLSMHGGDVAARLVWFAVNLVALAVGIVCAWRIHATQSATPGARLVPYALAPIAAVLLPLQTNFEHLNMNALLLGLLAGSTALLASGAMVAAGALVGVATALKAFPALLIVYFLARGYWRACIAAAATAVVLTMLPIGVYGAGSFAAQLLEWLRLGGSGWPIRGNNQSLIAALDRYTGAWGQAGVRQIADAPLAATLFGLTALLLVGALTVVIAHTPRRPSTAAIETSAVMILAVLLSPVAWDHYWVLALPGFAILYAAPGRGGFWIAALLVTGLSPLLLGATGYGLARQASVSTIAGLLLFAGLIGAGRRAGRTASG